MCFGNCSVVESLLEKLGDSYVDFDMLKSVDKMLGNELWELLFT